ncbi:MAG TPA: glutamate-1-semialdehyde 2,1-aminomutase [Fimbriimonadaceae bacterium]|nr:glutamate-1-semialdehyde 2,1-aminomutase [Fimbriimonadaceae bacterium]
MPPAPTTTEYSAAHSAALFAQAQELLPGGVNSPVRAFRAVGGTPLFFERAEGSKLYDVDGNVYIDFVSSWGAVILGHADPSIVRAITGAAARGTSFGAPHEGEVLLAEEVVARKPAVEMVRFVNSGTEATLATIRLVRAATGRDKIVKFEGNYHGAVDALLAKAGSGVATFGLPDSAGVPKSVTEGTLLAPYNDAEAVRALFATNPGQIAAVLVEPVAGNMGLIPPKPGFLEALRAMTTEHGALLVFDEVMTGFRIARGGATERFGVFPDLVCMGKVIGGGLPVGAYGGKRELMQNVAPAGPMYQAGTLSGNPLAMAAGYAALKGLGPEQYAQLEETSARLEAGLKQAAPKAQVQRVGSMISVFFAEAPVTDFVEAKASDTAFFAKLFHALLRRGVYLPPSALEAWFLNLAHTPEDIDRTVEAFAAAMAEVQA